MRQTGQTGQTGPTGRTGRTTPVAPPQAETFLYDYGGKRWNSCLPRFALGYPNVYAAGMANLGFLWIYHLLNSMDGVRCDRFFLDSAGARSGLATLEGGRPPSEYDVVGFSIPFEMDYLNVPLMLSGGGIEPLAARRDSPLVVAGGAAVSANPEPVADFLDAVFVGAGEKVIGEFVEAYAASAGQLGRTRKGFKKAFLESLAAVKGAYVPSLYRVSRHPDGRVAGHEPLCGAPESVARRDDWLPDSPPHSPVVSKGSAFPGMFLLELSRGCPYRCRFCLSGYTHRRMKTFSGSGWKEALERGLGAARRTGLVGVAFSSSNQLDSVCRFILDRGGEVSFSSLRLTRQAREVICTLGERLKLRTATLAPETPSPRLREIVNKHLEEDTPEAVETLRRAGVQRLKLYFLIGIPGEGAADVEAIADFSASLARPGMSVSLSVNPLVPKPFTPLQWMAMENRKSLEKKAGLLKARLSGMRDVSVKVGSPRLAEAQGLLSRGDRRLAGAVLECGAGGAAAAGGFMRATRRLGLNGGFFLYRERGGDETFPWDVLEYPFDRRFLRGEYETVVAKAGAS
ncbi:MAG: radical SAM protein [bacterium]